MSAVAKLYACCVCDRISNDVTRFAATAAYSEGAMCGPCNGRPDAQCPDCAPWHPSADCNCNLCGGTWTPDPACETCDGSGWLTYDGEPLVIQREASR